MKGKTKLIVISSICLSIIFILLGCLTPFIITNALDSLIADKAVLSKENHHDLWGKLPGKSETNVYQHFHFYNIENPDDIL